MLEITQAMNSRKADVAVGDEFAIELAENPTTGYRWQIQEMDKSAFEVLEDAFSPASGAVGAGGIRRWLIRARLPGDFHVAFEKKRSWEARGVESFTVKIATRSGRDEPKNQ